MDAENVYLAAWRILQANQNKKKLPTEEAAVECTLEAARKWIDQGKSELLPEKCDGDTIIQ